MERFIIVFSLFCLLCILSACLRAGGGPVRGGRGLGRIFRKSSKPENLARCKRGSAVLFSLCVLCFFTGAGSSPPPVDDSVPYPEEYLDAIVDITTEHMVNKTGSPELISSLRMVGTFPLENRVVVTMKDLTDEKIALFKQEICDSDAICFEEGDFILVNEPV